MKEKIGFPYTMLSDDMMQHAAAGYGGQGTLCGSLGACSALINLVTMDKNQTHTQMVAHLLNWYAVSNFPTDRFDAICYFPKQVRVVPNSPLCHISVSTWAMKAGVQVSSKEKKDRCAKVAGEVAFQTVLMLNDYADGKYKQSLPAVSAATAHCLSCHGPAGAENNQQGRMVCDMCHDDHTK
ncbi:MAG: C-GCAxxG-C-C family protein [Proteobacteria bacterium]|nr:C-GCAxxG-C-C family protein [Pseudomonadota bacterium]MBU1710565.1 C-GCAxxG-C-C family protein [Pseudomonadota bacterium]